MPFYEIDDSPHLAGNLLSRREGDINDQSELLLSILSRDTNGELQVILDS